MQPLTNAKNGVHAVVDRSKVTKKIDDPVLAPHDLAQELLFGQARERLVGASHSILPGSRYRPDCQLLIRHGTPAFRSKSDSRREGWRLWKPAPRIGAVEAEITEGQRAANLLVFIVMLVQYMRLIPFPE